MYIGLALAIVGAWVSWASSATKKSFLLGNEPNQSFAYLETNISPTEYIKAGKTEVLSANTATPYPTYTPYPTHTQMPTLTPSATITNTTVPSKTSTPQPFIYSPGIDPLADTIVPVQEYRARISYYWPPLGGINCDVINGEEECGQVASGRYWHYEGVGRWLACPAEFPFGTLFLINGFVWECQDRGGAIIKMTDGTLWLDLLYPYMPYQWTWGDTVNVTVISSYVPDGQ